MRPADNGRVRSPQPLPRHRQDADAGLWGWRAMWWA